MTESLCKHPDIRKFDAIRSCLSCGEAVFETSSPTAHIHKSDATASYQYTKLKYKLGREIRLVLVLPGSDQDALRCQIIHVNLDDDPVYDAVSYTWATEGGDASHCMTVQCEAGGFIPVTANCYAVLLQLRRSGGIRRLWIDAICIDQTNVNERNHQVGFMDQIYSNARSVRICIQDSSLTASLRDYNRLFSWLRCTGSENYTGIQTPLCSDLHHLLSLRYFRRVWVIQEVALAREVCLHVNNNVLLLDSAVMDRMESLRKQNRLRIPSALKWSTCRTIEAGIVACLQAAMKCNATDPRDEVYAVLSLMEPQARSLIPVDYSLDLDVVWRNAIAAIIITQGNLDILSHVGVYRHRSLLNNRVRRSYMNRVDIAGYLERVASSNSHHLTLPYSEGHRATPWRAQLVMPSNPSDIPQQSATFSIIGPPVNSNSLLPRFCVRAHYIDRIDVPMVFRPSLKKRKRGKDYGNDAVYYDWDQEPFDRIRSYSVRSLVAFFKADVDNVSTTDPHKPSHGTSGFHPGTVTSGSERPEALIMNDPSIEDTDLSEFIRICQTSRKGRPLFTSHFSVGFPGISSMKRIVQQGDEIFAIDGARTPFILRKRGRVAENYKIIDECYLWAALELDCWNPGTRKGRWGPGVERPTTTQTRMINIC